MNRMLVVVFDDEMRAREGENVLQRLEREGGIIVYGHAVLAKSTAGTVNLMRKQDYGPLDTLLSTPLGSVIALLGGPSGLSISAATGFTFGKGYDADNARLGEDFVDDVRKAFLPGKVAILAEIREGWTAPVDARMGEVGGVVFRRSLSNVRRNLEEDTFAAMQADIVQLTAEQSLSESDRKTELQKKINQLSFNIHVQLQRAQERRDAASQTASDGFR